MGTQGSLDATESLKSLNTAFHHREAFQWQVYCLATNANYTGSAFEKILNEATALGLPQQSVEHLGPEYWNDLCERHEDSIADRFDYKITVGVNQVVEAFRKARYLDKYVKEFEEKIRKAHFSLVVTNNRTPAKVEIPFSPKLSVENYLDATKELLGISLQWTNFPDLRTSAGPSLSITIDRRAQPFSKKIAELPINSGEELQLWISIVWRDEEKDDGTSVDGIGKTHLACRMAHWVTCYHERPADERSRRNLTISRQERIVQAMAWQGVHALVSGTGIQDAEQPLAADAEDGAAEA